MTAATAPDIFDQIAAGTYDDQISAIFDALRERRKFVSAQAGVRNKAAMTPGTPVVIHSGIQPKYLLGVTGKVSARPARRAGDIMVEVDEDHRHVTGRFGGQFIGVPAACLARL